MSGKAENNSNNMFSIPVRTTVVVIMLAMLGTILFTVFTYAHFYGRLNDSNDAVSSLATAYEEVRQEAIDAGRPDPGAIDEVVDEEDRRGLPGLDGEVGPRGPQGRSGDDGETGPAGPAGADGEDGTDGEQGPAGPQGEQGDTGTGGTSGTSGEPGPQGDQGPVGPQGPEGPTGSQGPAVESFTFTFLGIDYSCTDPEVDGSYACVPS